MKIIPTHTNTKLFNLVTGVITVVLQSTCVYALTPEEEARISLAAQTETSGAKSTQSAQGQALSFDPSNQHIITAQRNTEAKEAAKRAKARADEQVDIVWIKTERTTARTALQKEATQLANYGKTVDELIAKEKKEIADAKAARSKSTLDRLAGQAGFGKSAEAENYLRDATARLKKLEAEKATNQAKFNDLKQRAQESERKFAIDLVKAEESRKTAEESRRTAEAKAAASRVQTQRVQNEQATIVFQDQLNEIDRQLVIARKNNIPSVIAELEANRRKTQETFSALEVTGTTALKSAENDLRRTYDLNRQDGIGPSSTNSLYTNLNKEARANGKSTNNIKDLVDKEAVSSSKKRATIIATGAPKNTEHVSLFNGISQAAMNDFLLDMKEDRKTMDWTEFSLRMGSYYKGVGRAGKDAIVDLVKLVGEVGDTAGEAFEQEILSRLGIESHVFGRENMELLKKLAQKGGALIDPNDPEGAKVAKQAVDLFNKLSQVAKRDLERRAVGNLRKNLEGVGYLTGTVVGAEAVAIEGALIPLKALNKTRNAWKAQKAADALDVSDDFAKLDTPDARPLTTDAPSTGGNAPDGSTAPPPVNPSAETVAPPRSGDGPTNRPATGNPAIDAATKATSPVQIIKKGDDLYIRRQADGVILKLEKKLGSGEGSDVYAIPGRDDFVIKITKAEKNFAEFDDMGYKALKSIDPKGEFFEVPTKYSSNPVTGTNVPEYDGAVVSTLDRAPKDFKGALKNGNEVKLADGSILKPATGDMTPGQILAYQEAMTALNNKGWVWMDNKYDNYAFRHMGGDKWKLVIVDPGGIYPAKTPAAARRTQRFIDNPSDATRAVNDIGSYWGILANLYDANIHEMIDWKKLSKLIGRDVSELNQVPINISNGTRHTELNELAGAASNGLTADPARVKTGLKKKSDKLVAGAKKDRKKKKKEPGDADFVGGADKDLGTGDSGVHTAAGSKSNVGKKRSPYREIDKGEEDESTAFEDAGYILGPLFTSTAGKRPTTGTGSGSSGESDGSLVSVGGSFVPVADPMFFEFGGTFRPRTGISTDCPSWCLYLVNQYSELALSSPLTELIKQQMHVIKSTTLPVCEAENCGDEDEWDYISKIMTVFPISDLNPYQRQSLVSIGTESTPPVIVTPPTSPLPPETPQQPETPVTPVAPPPPPPAQEPPEEMTPPLQVTSSGNPSFSHSVGVTECPTNAGAIRVTSNNQNALSKPTWQCQEVYRVGLIQRCRAIIRPCRQFKQSLIAAVRLMAIFPEM